MIGCSFHETSTLLESNDVSCSINLMCLHIWSLLQSERAELISQIKALRDNNRQFQSIVDEKIKEIEPLQQALGKLRTANNRGGLCSSEEELNDVVCYVSQVPLNA